jgi:hypothetical protein
MSSRQSSRRGPSRRKLRDQRGYARRGQRRYAHMEKTTPPTEFLKMGRSMPVCPEAIQVTMRYSDPTVTRMVSATPYNVFVLLSNDVYDPDPALGSGAISGFNEWCNFYSKWRVQGIKVEWEAINLNAQPITVYMFFGADTVIPLTYAATVDFAELPMASKIMTLGPNTSGSNRARIVKSSTIAKIYGRYDEYIANELYQGTGGSSPGSPANKMEILFLAYSSANLTLGIYSRVRVSYDVQFFSRVDLTS